MLANETGTDAPSPGLLREEGSGPLADLQALPQSEVLPPQRGQLLGHRADQAVSLARIGLDLTDPPPHRSLGQIEALLSLAPLDMLSVPFRGWGGER